MKKNEKMKRIREELKLSQREVGEKVGMTSANISNLEMGKIGISNEVIDRYVSAFNIDKDSLLDDSKEVIFKGIKNNVTSKQIKLLREELGLTQEEFAKETHVPQSTISKIERAEIKTGIETIKRIADTYNVGADWLLYGEERKKNYPVNDKLINYLWNHEEVRKIIYEYMKEE